IMALGLPSAAAAIRGRSQTDFVPAGVDKASGVRACAAALGVDADQPLAFAIGDSASDLPMLRLAKHAYVPLNARSLASGRTRIAPARYVAGFIRAVQTQLGHRVGSCQECAPPGLSGHARPRVGATAPPG